MKKREPKHDSLFELVNSLEPRERRYVSIYLRQFKERNNIYFNLFNLVSKGDISGSDKTSQVIRIQLYWKILKALQLYQSENDPIVHKNNLLSQSHVLQKKGLDSHALRVLKNAKEVCKANDLTDDLFFIDKEETRIRLEENEGLKNEHLISGYNKSSLDQLKTIRQNYSLHKVYLQNKLNLDFFKPALNDTAYKISNSYSLNLKQDEILSDYGSILNYLNLGLYNLGIKEVSKSLYYFLNAYKVYVAHHDLIRSHNDKFCELLQLICNTYLLNNKLVQLHKWITQLSSELKSFGLYNIEKRIIVHLAQADICLRSKKLKKMAYQISTLKELKPANKNLKYNFYIDYQCIRYYIETKDLEVVSKAMNAFLNEYPLNYRPHYQMAMRLYYIIVLFLKKDHFTLTYEVKRTKYYFKKYDSRSEFAKNVLEDLAFYAKKGLANKERSYEEAFLNNLSDYLELNNDSENFGLYLNFKTLV
jgi:hypothetical protein